LLATQCFVVEDSLRMHVKVQLSRLRIQTYCMIVNRTTAYWFTKNLWPYRKSCYCHWRTVRWTRHFVPSVYQNLDTI